MSQLVKSLIVATIGLLFAGVLGVQVGEGSWLAPALILGACLILFLYLLFFRSVQVETPIVGLLLFGYIVGNRGFAQLSLGGQNSPLYVGEVSLAICVALLGVRLAVNREQPIPRIPVAWVIVGFLVLGGVRLYLDAVMRVNGASPITAIRDSATVYYALFFFVAYRLGKRSADRQFLDKWIYFGCLLLLPVVAIQFAAPSFFANFTIGGVPLILQKGDLLGTFLAFSSFYFFLKPSRGVAAPLNKVLSLVFFGGMLVLMSRASFVGAGLAALLLLAARQPRFIVYQLGTIFLALLVFGILRASDLQGEASIVSRLADKIESVTDVSGTGDYRGRTGDTSAANNQFRLVWWQSIFDDTMEKAPWFGLGFGSDLAKTFLRAYYGNRAMDFTARSPHSIWFTMLGRMGLIGLLAFTVLVFLVVREAWQAARRVAVGRAEPATLGHWCAVVILLGSASFGVVLEGPMGGILFWSMLGLAASQTAPQRVPPAPEPAATPEQMPPRRRELAMAR